MTIPAKYQIFNEPVVLSDKDARRLSAYMANWLVLAPVVYSMSSPDLKRCVILELMDARREQLLDKLIARIARLHRKELTAKIKGLLK